MIHTHATNCAALIRGESDAMAQATEYQLKFTGMIMDKKEVFTKAHNCDHFIKSSQDNTLQDC